MKISLSVVKEFVTFFVSIFPCVLIALLFYFAIRLYSSDHALVLIPIISCLVVLYTFFQDEEETNKE
ncbi:hypothetical protein [Desulforamulus ferrireducens]|uniref:Uncharacterized protein n=1 Tax=Desulforamulus ferrireducens TaxID=1833852 RepID=A0A1S6IWT7_9FIRM|nr:hypothetical protein [Desulforamulus ferrireducens]AQS59237.1 hypothetical protein B0537_09180 [Desulforamulus ferrireducens]